MSTMVEASFFSDAILWSMIYLIVILSNYFDSTLCFRLIAFSLFCWCWRLRVIVEGRKCRSGIFWRCACAAVRLCGGARSWCRKNEFCGVFQRRSRLGLVLLTPGDFFFILFGRDDQPFSRRLLRRQPLAVDPFSLLFSSFGHGWLLSFVLFCCWHVGQVRYCHFCLRPFVETVGLTSVASFSFWMLLFHVVFSFFRHRRVQFIWSQIWSRKIIQTIK